MENSADLTPGVAWDKIHHPYLPHTIPQIAFKVSLQVEFPSQFSRKRISNLTTFEAANLQLPAIRKDLVISWSSIPPQDILFTQLDSIPPENAVRLFANEVEFFPDGIPILSIALRTDTDPDKTVFLPLAALNFWIDVHNFTILHGRSMVAKNWLCEQLTYNDKVSPANWMHAHRSSSLSSRQRRSTQTSSVSK